MAKYWAISVFPLMPEKGFFMTHSQITEWRDQLLKLSKRKWEEEQFKLKEEEREPFPKATKKRLQDWVHILDIEESKLDCTLFLKEKFPYTKWSER